MNDGENEMNDLERNSNFNGRQTLRIIFGKKYEEEITEKIRKIKDNSITILQTKTKEIETELEKFQNEIDKYITDNSTRITKSFNLSEENDLTHSFGIKTYAKNYTNVLEKIFNLHNQIMETIKENFKILNRFLHIPKYLNRDKPIQEFLNDNLECILKSWLFPKLDLDKFNITKALKKTNLDSNYKTLITSLSQNRNFVLNINKKQDENDEKQKENDIKVIVENYKKLGKLQFNGVDDYENYLPENCVFNELQTLIINNVQKVSLKDTQNKIYNKFPSLAKFSLINCHLISDFDKIIYFPKNLKKLSFEKCSLINEDFCLIINSLIHNEEIKNSLEYISFANNYINKVDFNQFIFQVKNTFYEIREMNFQKNNIYKFSFSPEFFPELRVINCTFNNFSRPILNQLNEKILVLLNNNIFLTDNNLRNDYFNKLNNQITNFDYGVKFLSFNSLFSKAFNKINEISISENMIIAIKILDLSYCSLTNEMLFEFFRKNIGCFNLSSLYLKGNELNDDFFSLFLNNNMQDIIRKLQYINLYDNNIEGNNLDIVYEFITKNKNLSFLNICNNPLSDNYQILNDENIITKEELNLDSEIKNDLNLLFKKIDIQLPKSDLQSNSNRSNFQIKFDCGNYLNLLSTMPEIKSSKILLIKNQ